METIVYSCRKFWEDQQSREDQKDCGQQFETIKAQRGQEESQVDGGQTEQTRGCVAQRNEEQLGDKHLEEGSRSKEWEDAPWHRRDKGEGSRAGGETGRSAGQYRFEDGRD